MPGFNIESQFVSNRGKLVNWTRDHKPDAHTVIDDYKQGYSLIRELHDASPTTLFVHRHYHPHGENTPDYLNVLDFNAPEYVIYNIGNEPGLSGADLGHTLSYLVAAAHLGASLGKPMCLGNFSTGSWQQSDIDKGFFDEYLGVLDIYHDLHYGGIHEYKLARLDYPFNNGRVPKDLVNLDKANERVTPEQFIRDSASNFHIGRYLWLVDRCIKLGIREPRFILTEYGLDRNRDELEHVPEIDSFAERRVTGVNTIQTYNRKMWNDQSWEQSLVYQIGRMETCYTSHVKGKCWFCWNAA